MRKYKVCNEEVYLATGQELKQLAGGKVKVKDVATVGLQAQSPRNGLYQQDNAVGE